MLAGIRLFIVRGNAVVGAENFVRLRPAIERLLDSHHEPFIAKVLRHPNDDTKPGSIKLWLTYDAWRRRFRK